jgi:hypothetical protein
MAVDDLRDGRREKGVGINIVEFASLDQRSDHGPMFCAAIGAGEQRILAIEGDRPDPTFDDLGVNLNAAVVDEAAQPVPA